MNAKTKPRCHEGNALDHEKLFTLKAAAEVLELHYWQLQRAVKRGELPAYQPFNSRKLVKLSDIQIAIEASKIGGVL